MATATIRISGPFTKDLAPAATSSAEAPVAQAKSYTQTKSHTQTKPWYRRLFDLMVEARMAQAVREIERHRAWTDQLGPYRNLTPSDLELSGLRGAMSGRLPFNRD